jgi:hypothetical protein
MIYAGASVYARPSIVPSVLGSIYPTTSFLPTASSTIYPATTVLPAASTYFPASTYAFPTTSFSSTVHPATSFSSIYPATSFSSTVYPATSFSSIYPATTTYSTSTYGGAVRGPVYGPGPYVGGGFGGGVRYGGGWGGNNNNGLFDLNGGINANIRNSIYANALDPIIPGIGATINTFNDVSLLSNSGRYFNNIVGGNGYNRDPLGSYVRGQYFANQIGDFIPGVSDSLNTLNKLNFYAGLF